jgi:hypothetical protein
MNWDFDLIEQTWRCGRYLIQGFILEGGEARFTPYCFGEEKQSGDLDRCIVSWPHYTLQDAKDACESHAAEFTEVR